MYINTSVANFVIIQQPAYYIVYQIVLFQIRPCNPSLYYDISGRSDSHQDSTVLKNYATCLLIYENKKKSIIIISFFLRIYSTLATLYNYTPICRFCMIFLKMTVLLCMLQVVTMILRFLKQFIYSKLIIILLQKMPYKRT